MNERSSEFLALKRFFYGGSLNSTFNSYGEVLKAEADFYQNAQDQNITFSDIIANTAGSVVAYKMNVAIGNGAGGTYTAAQLAAGVTAFTPSIGDVILHASLSRSVLFDGTTPLADFGTFVNSTTGVIKDVSGYPFYLDADPSTISIGGDGLEIGDGSNPNDILGSAFYEGSWGKGTVPIVTQANPIKVVASQNGAKNGTALDSTVGEFIFRVVIVKASSMTIL